MISKQTWQDVEFSFRARAPLGTEEVQIWAGLRCRDRDSRYVFGLRGGNNDHVYLALYAPEGGDRFLGIAPLNIHPEPGAWYTLRAVMCGNRIHIYVKGETIPRINVTDPEALWTEGGVSLGRGWLPAEFDDVRAGSLSPSATASFTELSDAVHGPSPLDKDALRAQQRSPISLQDSSSELNHGRCTLWTATGSLRRCRSLLRVPRPMQRSSTTRLARDAGTAFLDPTVTWLYAEMGFPASKDCQRPRPSAIAGMNASWIV